MQPKDPQYTQVKFNKDAIDALYEGVSEVCEAVATTLGPKGRNVLIDKGYSIDVVHDGVETANAINPEEPFKNRGARLIQEAAKKQRDAVGDGTTVVTILTKAILDKALEATASGIEAMDLRAGLESGADKVIHKIEELSTKISTLDQKIQIGTISAENPILGKLIAETIHEIGDDGVFTVEESKASETYVEKQEGMQLEKPMAQYFMMTDVERQLAVLEDVPILVTDFPLTNLPEISTFLDEVVFKNSKKCIFISPEIGGDFLQAMLGAKLQGQFLGLAIRAPGIGWMQSEILQDIAALTGATFVTREAGKTLNDYTYEVLGKAERVQAGRVSSIIIGGSGHKDDVLQRIQVIKTQMKDDTLSGFDHEQLKGRLAKLTNGVAVVKIGGQTEVEMKERKERAIDAIASVQAAVKHGFVPGGEIIYLNCLDALDDSILGERILKEALKQPFKRLVENAGYDGGEILTQVRWENEDHWSNPTIGFDVMDGQFKNMAEAGIIDATSISTTAVKTAVSVAVQLSSLGAAIVIKNDAKMS